MIKGNLFVILFFFFLAVGCSLVRTMSPLPDVPSKPEGPVTEREFRAAWIASVANINWPSKPGLSTGEQQEEAIALLDLLQHNHFNAAILQIRPQCDALYKSKLEPWSYFLTGEQGKAPDPYYDPLEFWVTEAHRRGLELHVWLNPYRAHHPSGGKVTGTSIVNTRPDLAVPLKNGYWWLDPGKPGTREHGEKVVMDIVGRYDIDGVHFDDYFYPYPSYNNNGDFPDDESYNTYKAGGGDLARNDWRRENVNTFIEEIYHAIKASKPWVKFGLSPFGIWRPENPPSIAGFDQYEVLYADARLWLNMGWIDYFTPQLYWPTNQYRQSFPVLLGWWTRENLKDRHIWPGINIGRTEGNRGIDETINEIMITRGFLPDNPGNIHWSIGPLVRYPDLTRAIFNGPYAREALIPPSPWLDKTAPVAPVVEINISNDTLKVSMNHTDPDDVSHWVVYFRYTDNWDYQILNKDERSCEIPLFYLKSGIPANIHDLESTGRDFLFNRLKELEVSAVDRTGNESRHSIPVLPDLENIMPPSLKEEWFVRNPDKDQSSPGGVNPVVIPGINVLLDEHPDLIEGKRIGLITNQTAVDSNFRSDIDILRGNPAVDLVALFAPEYGLTGVSAKNSTRNGDPDPVTGIPVYNLYGNTNTPRPDWLQNIDVMIFDIQGTGTAWCTFKYTMARILEACAETGIPLIVPDRPNPLGGEEVEGPLLSSERGSPFPLPLRHGMTIGELATMWNDSEGIGADLTVIKMKGWRRNLLWNETGLLWIMPTPEVVTFESDMAFAGQNMLESSNISEASGTPKPFLFSGAPWIDGDKTAKELNEKHIPGVIFRPVRFIPEKADAGDNPSEKPWNRLCSGVEIMLTDYKSYRPVETSLHILEAYRKYSPDSLKWNTELPFQLPVAERKTVEEMIAGFNDRVREFREKRKKYLLYR